MKYLYWLLILAPLAVAAKFMHASPLVVFALSAAAIIPLEGAFLLLAYAILGVTFFFF